MNEVPVIFDGARLRQILQVPASGFDDFASDYDDDCLLTTKFSQGRIKNIMHRVLKGEMKPFHKLLLEFVDKCVLPRTKRRHKASLCNLAIMYVLDLDLLINLPALMIKHMSRIVDPSPGPHGLAYGFFLFSVFAAFVVPLGKGRLSIKKELLCQCTLMECNCVPTGESGS